MPDFKKIELAIVNLEKRFGKNAVVQLGRHNALKVDVIPTGIPSVDRALGIGGFPRGRIVEIFGPEAGGKTTLALQAIAQAQAMGGAGAVIDAEHALDPKYAAALKVNTDALFVSQPSCGEEALEIAEGLITTGELDIIVIDSVAALVPKAELEGEMGDSVTGDTPVWLRNEHGLLDLLPIEDLYGGSTKFFGKRYTNHYKKNKKLQIFTGSGWSEIKRVFFKKNVNNKPIIATHTAYGLAKTTPDHSLFVDKKEFSPKELLKGNKLDTARPTTSLDKQPCSLGVAWLLGYFCADGSLTGTNIFFGSVEERLILKAKDIAQQELCVKTRTGFEDRKPPRQVFHTISFTPRKAIVNLFSNCYSYKSKYKKIPDVILNATLEIRKAFLDGFLDGDGSNLDGGFAAHTSSFVLAAGIQWLMDNENLKGSYLSINNRANHGFMFQLCTNKSGICRWEHNEIKEFIQLPAPEYLYDIETSSGTFVGGVGYIVHHNSQMGLQARLMSQAMRKLTGAVSRTKTCLVFINQLRSKIGVVYGSPDTTTGGRALKFYASLRIDVRRTADIKDGDEKIGAETKIKIVKNKLSSPFKEATPELYYGKGFSQAADLLNIGSELGIVEKSGAWYSYQGERLGQGKINAMELLSNDTVLAQKIFNQVRQKIMIPEEVKNATRQ